MSVPALEYYATASTSLININTLSAPYVVVYLSSVSFPGLLVTVRDTTGSSNITLSNSSIVVSTLTGVSFVNPADNGIAITQPFGYLTLGSLNASNWNVQNTFGFPASNAAASYSNIFAQNGYFSNLSVSSIGINCNAPAFELDVRGKANISTGLTVGGIQGTRFWLAGGFATNKLAVSRNGINWTGIGDPINTVNVRALQYNGELWVAVGDPTNSIAFSINGYNWTGLGSSIFSTNGSFVIWNGKIWLAGGLGTNTLAYSFDGISWTGLGTTPFSTHGIGAVWNGTIFVAVGQGTNSIAYSYDGLRWIGLGTSIFSTNGSGVAWNGEYFVAVGQGTNSIAYSRNGINWIGLGTSIFSHGRSIATDGKMWVAVGESANTIAYSLNGINWLGLGTSIISIRGRVVRWGPNIWVAGGEGVNTQAYSLDGINWVGLGATIFTNGGFSAIWAGYNGNSTMQVFGQLAADSISTTGPVSIQGDLAVGTFSYVSSVLSSGGFGFLSTSLNSVLYVDSKNSKVGVNCNSPAFELDVLGTGHATQFSSLQTTVSSLGVNCNAPAFQLDVRGTANISTGLTVGGYSASRLWVAVGQGLNTIAVSRNGINWTGLGIIIFTIGRSIAWNGSIFVATGDGTNTLAYSRDGFNWVGLGATIFSTSGRRLAWNGMMWVATGSGTNTLAYSFDGIQWFGLGTSVFTSNGYSVAWNGNLWVAGGDGTNTLAYSYDGIRWIGLGLSPFSLSVFGITWNGKLWAAVGRGSANNVAYSYDGINWIGRGLLFPAAGNGQSVVWNGSMFVASGNIQTVGGNSLAYSYDGINWVGLGGSIFSGSCIDVAWNGEFWIAGGFGTNTLAFSLDGINWTGISPSPFTAALRGITWVSYNGNSTIQAFGQLAADTISTTGPVSIQGDFAVGTYPYVSSALSTVGRGELSTVIQPAFYVGAVNREIDVNGTLYVDGDTLARGSISTGSNLTVFGATYLTGMVSTLSNVFVRGHLSTLSNIGVGGDVSILSNLNVRSNTTLQGNLTVLGTTNIGTGTFTSASTLTISSGFGTFTNLNVNGIASVSSLRVGGARSNDTSENAANEIRFYGTASDGAGTFTHTVIAERNYQTGSERSELLFFKGNDPQGLNGPDRIRFLTVGSLQVDFTIGGFADWPLNSPPPSSTGTALQINATNANNSNFRVGVNCNNPQYTLDVAGTIRGDGNLYLGPTTSVGLGEQNMIVQFATDGGSYIRNLSTNGRLFLGTQSTNYMYIESNGNIGINTFPSAYALEVGGITRVSTLWVGNTGTSINYGQNDIRFFGTQQDGRGAFNSAVISERIFASNEKSELLLFKGGQEGNDGIRLLMDGFFKVDGCPAASGAWASNAPPPTSSGTMIYGIGTNANNSNFLVGINNILNPTQTLDVGGTGQFRGDLTAASTLFASSILLTSGLGQKISLWGSNSNAYYGFAIQANELRATTNNPQSRHSWGWTSNNGTFTEWMRLSNAADGGAGGTLSLNCNAPPTFYQLYINGGLFTSSIVFPWAGTRSNNQLLTQFTSPSTLSWQWGDGTGWRFYFRGASTRNINLLTLVDSGSIGINCNSPAYTLDVNATARFNSNLLVTQNVGIGTTSPAYALDVNGIASVSSLRVGAAAASTSNSNANVNEIRFYGTFGDSPGSYANTVIAERIYDTTLGGEASELVLFKGNDGSNGAGPDRIRMLTSGRFVVDFVVSGGANSTWPANSPPPPTTGTAFAIVPTNPNNSNFLIGVNLTTPIFTLDAFGDARLNKGLDTSVRIHLGPSPSATNLDYTSVIEATNTFSTNFGSDLRFYTHGTTTNVASTERMRITNVGNVGIACNSPQFTLDVNGTFNKLSSNVFVKAGAFVAVRGTGNSNSNPFWFSSTIRSFGSAVTDTGSSVNGSFFTMQSAGWYSIVWNLWSSNANQYFALIKNHTAGTPVNIGPYLSNVNENLLTLGFAGANGQQVASGTFYFNQSDTVVAYSQSVLDADADARYQSIRITRVAAT